MKITWQLDAQRHEGLQVTFEHGRAYNVPDVLGVAWCQQGAATPLGSAAAGLVMADVSRRLEAARAELQAFVAAAQAEQRKAAAARPEFGPIDDAIETPAEIVPPAALTAAVVKLEAEMQAAKAAATEAEREEKAAVNAPRSGEEE